MKLNINFSRHAKHLERLITDNSPTILTALGVAGVAGTAVLTWKATKQSEEVLASKTAAANAKRGADEPRVERFTRAEVFSHTWKLYIAPVCVGVLTGGCIIAANRISARRAAAVAGILALTQDNFKEYKDKVKEKMTGPQYKKVDEELAQENVQKALDKQGTIHIPDGRVQCVEAWTKRPFLAEYNQLLHAENEINRKILKEDSASLSSFYDILGLEHTDSSDDFGWNTTSPLELDLIPVETSDHKPAFNVVYVEKPMYRPWQAGSFR